MNYRHVCSRLNRSSVFFLIALLATSLRAQVNLTVNATQTIRTVDERVFGANSVIWDGEADNDQTISLLQAAGLRCVRIPGGSLSDEYHWRTNMARDYTWKWATGFDGFAKVVNGLNSQTFVSVNYGSGTAQEAAALVAYANATTGSSVAIGADSKGYNWQNSGTWAGLRASTPSGGADDGMDFLRTGRASPLGLKYWEIGNECYGSWEYDVQPLTHDPTTYANRARDYITAMKAVDPTIKVGVVVVTSGENANYKNWTPVMLARLKALGTNPDFVIYHSYPQAPGSESDAALLQQANTWATSAADIRQQLTTYLGAAGSGVEIVVTENNSVYSDPGKQSTSLVNGLYLADSIANVMKTEINAFMWWAIRNGTPTDPNTHAIIGNFSSSLYGWRTYGDYGMISTPVSAPTTGGATSYWNLHPTYYAMKLLSKFARGGDTIVQATSDSTFVSVFGAKRVDGSLCLLVINKHPTNPQNTNINLSGYTPGSTATVFSYGKTEDAGASDITTTQMSVSGAIFTASFAPYTATVISIQVGAAPVITTQPLSQTVIIGHTVNFNCVASGVPAPSYQWFRNGISIAGATGASYSISNAAIKDAGAYTVKVTNVSGSVTSQTATLTVQVASAYDFNLDAKSDLLWQNRTTGERLIWLMNGTSVSSGVGLSTVPSEWEIAATGDFNADGMTDLVWENAVTGERTVWLMNGASVSSAAGLGTIPPEWVIAATGDFNADGNSDLIWQNTQTGERSIWLMNGTNVISGVGLGTISPEWWIAGTGDFNYDGQTDIYWQNTVTGQHLIWYMNGTTVSSGAGLGTYAQYSVAGIGDYNNDGKPDLVMTNNATGERQIWLMNGTTVASTVSLTTLSLDWVLNRPIPRRTQADFNRDGKTDIIWQNSITGERMLWLMNGTTVASGVSLATIPIEWTIAATGDFNNDGKSDIVWQNTTTGERSIWLMNGPTVSSGAGLGVTPVAWTISTSGDFNNDGKSDLLLQNTTTNEAVVWLMDGTAKTSTVSLGVQASWRIATAGDFNNDGKSDIVWRNPATGQHKIWLMNGTAKTSEVVLGTFGAEWAITGSGDFNQDGKSDLLWQNSITGERLLWLMDGTSVSTGLGLGTYPTEWSLTN